MLTGRDIDASEADRIGLVSRVVPQAELLPACFELADRINGWSRAGVELTKRQLWNSLDASSLQSHMDAEGHLAALRPHHDAQLRGVGGGPQGGADAPTSRTEAIGRRSGCVDERAGRHLEVVPQLDARRAGAIRPSVSAPTRAPSMWRSQASRSAGPMTKGAWRMRSRGWPRSSP